LPIAECGIAGPGRNSRGGRLALNGLDFAILFTFLAIIGLGFFGGILRVFSAIAAIYVASVVSAATYGTLATAFRNHVTSVNLSTAELFTFITSFGVTAVVVWLILARGLRDLRLSRRVEIADNLGGATLGVIVSAMAVTLAVMLLSILLQVLNQSVGSGGTSSMGGAVQGQINESQLVPLFLDLSPYFARMIGAWFPHGIPAILA
jgi:uncharacterized membrane protein required for colicin V production